MDQRKRLAQLGKSALQYALHRYMARYPSLSDTEVDLLTKLVSSPTFLGSLDPVERFGGSTIESVQARVDGEIGPRIATFLGLANGGEAMGAAAAHTPAPATAPAPAPAPTPAFAPAPPAPTHPPAPTPDLFNSLSDEELLKDSSFANQTSPPRDTGFDLADGDTWYPQFPPR